jgi:hypothetical protein
MEPEPLTSSGRTNPGGLILNHIEVDVENRLLDTATEHVSGEADHLLGPNESVCHVIRYGAKAFVTEHSKLVQPGMIDEACIAQPVDRELWVVGVWDDCCNDAGLEKEWLSYT